MFALGCLDATNAIARVILVEAIDAGSVAGGPNDDCWTRAAYALIGGGKSRPAREKAYFRRAESFL